MEPIGVLANEEHLSVTEKSIDDLFDELMEFEIEFEDQLEENLSEFERTLSTHLDHFIQIVEVSISIFK